jgi:hypothetical protein
MLAVEIKVASATPVTLNLVAPLTIAGPSEDIMLTPFRSGMMAVSIVKVTETAFIPEMDHRNFFFLNLRRWPL